MQSSAGYSHAAAMKIVAYALHCGIVLLCAALHVHAARNAVETLPSAFCASPDKPGREVWPAAHLVHDVSPTYTSWQTRASIPWRHNLQQSQVRMLEQLHMQPLLLSESQIAQGITSMGDVTRMLRFCRKLVSGEPVKIVLLGGTWTSGAGVENPNNAWAAHLLTWINTTFPNPGHACIKKCIRGAASRGILASCMHTLIPADADLVVLESAVSGAQHKKAEQEASDVDWFEDSLESPARRAFERVLRRLVALQNSPAIIYMHPWEGAPQNSLHWDSQAKDTTVLAHYGLASLSMRNSLHPLLLKQPEVQADIWPPGSPYPSCLGTRLFADLIIAYLMKQCEYAVWGAIRLHTEQQKAAQVSDGISRPLQHLPPPLFWNNDQPSDCFLEETEMQQITSATQGFVWTNEGTASNPGWGDVGTAPQEIITPQFGQEDFDDREGPVTIDISLLTSHEHMGMLEVACNGGCACNTSMFDSCKPEMTGQEVHWAFQHVEITSHAEACTVQLTSFNGSGCQGQKLQLLGLLLSGKTDPMDPASVTRTHQHPTGVQREVVNKQLTSSQ